MSARPNNNARRILESVSLVDFFYGFKAIIAIKLDLEPARYARMGDKRAQYIRGKAHAPPVLAARDHIFDHPFIQTLKFVCIDLQLHNN